ncbi:MAG: methionyl-tRNA formyltransferase [Pseudomonadota bacterium]
MRLAFMGTPDFAVPVLEALHAAGHDIVRVYSQPPRPAGRGKALRPSPVHKAADALQIPVSTPETFRDPGALAEFRALAPDVAIVVAYGQILTKEALDAPRLGCLNLHASLLPRWRGAAPIQRAIMAGDSETGVGVMQMDVGLDTGDILTEARTLIGSEDTAASLHDRLAEIGAPLMVDTLAGLNAGTVRPQPQPEDGVTYAHKIDKAEARIDWSRPGDALYCHIRGISPLPGAWCEIGGERVKVLMSQSEEGSGTPGQALDGNLLIGTGAGAIRLLRLQRAGKGTVDARAFLNGTPVAPGTMLA